MDNDKELLMKLLYYALLEMREDAYLQKNQKVYHLTNLFNSVPLDFLNVDSEKSYSEILNRIENDAQSNEGLSRWVKRVKEHIKSD